MIAIFAAVAMHWLVLNDIHLNPYDRRQHVPYAQDTNPWLFHQALEQMHRTDPDARVIVLGGDLLAHHFPALARDARENPYTAARSTVRSIAQQLNAAFPKAQVLLAIGNNDDPCGDYHSETGGPYAADIAAMFEPLVNRGGASPHFVRDYVRGGYYTAMLPNGMRAVVLNSVLWSFVYRGPCQTHGRHAPADEMTWAASELSAGSNVVVMHMPLGFDPQSTTYTHRIVAVPFLSEYYDRRLRAIFAHDRSHVAFAVVGHTHRYDFRVPGGVPMLVASSLSPVYRNSPAFYELDVDERGLRDVVPFTFDRSESGWTREPSFDALYGTSAFDAPQLAQLHDRISSDPAVRERWIEAYDAWSWRVGDVSDHRWQTFACAQTAFGKAYGTCAGTTKRSYAALVALAIAVIGVLLAVFTILRLRRRR